MKSNLGIFTVYKNITGFLASQDLVFDRLKISNDLHDETTRY
jgi:hypothetical protein